MIVGKKKTTKRTKKSTTARKPPRTSAPKAVKVGPRPDPFPPPEFPEDQPTPGRLSPHIEGWIKMRQTTPNMVSMYPLTNRGHALDLSKLPSSYILQPNDYRTLDRAGIQRDPFPVLPEVEARLLQCGISPENMRALSWPEIISVLDHHAKTDPTPIVALTQNEEIVLRKLAESSEPMMISELKDCIGVKDRGTVTNIVRRLQQLKLAHRPSPNGRVSATKAGLDHVKRLNQR